MSLFSSGSSLFSFVIFFLVQLLTGQRHVASGGSTESTSNIRFISNSTSATPQTAPPSVINLNVTAATIASITTSSLFASNQTNLTLTDASFVCPDSLTVCADGSRCIDQRMRCDHQEDCADGSDEHNCSQSCDPVTEFTCPFTGECKSKMYLCDGNSDCLNGVDESNCGVK